MNILPLTILQVQFLCVDTAHAPLSSAQQGAVMSAAPLLSAQQGAVLHTVRSCTDLYI